MKIVIVQSSEEINVSVSELFKHITKRDLLAAFNSMPFVPDFVPIGSVGASRNEGSQRIIFFEDGNSAREIFLTFIDDWSFSMRIDNFSSIRLSPLSWLEYQFVFYSNTAESSIISTTYQFKMRSTIEMILFKVLVRNFMQKHLDSFLRTISHEISDYSNRPFFN